MPVLPTVDDKPLDVAPGFGDQGKTVDRPDAYSRFPRTNHHPNVNKSTLSLAHPDVPVAAERTDLAASGNRYKHTPTSTNPFDASRPEVPVRGIKSAKASPSFNVTEHNAPPERPVVCRKPVSREAKVDTHGIGKKTGGTTKNDLSTSEYKTAADVHDALRCSGRYKTSRRFEEGTDNVTHYNPTVEKGPQHGVDARFKYTTAPKTLHGVLSPSRDNCEDRGAKVQPPPWALDKQ